MILLISCGSSKTPRIKEFLEKNDQQVRVVDLNDFVVSDLEDAKGIIISGSPILVTDVSAKEKVERLRPVIDANIPVLGICFGHQVLALLFGAQAEIGDEIKGESPVRIVKESTIFTGLEGEVVFDQSHCEEVTLPTNFKRIATSKTCVNEAMQHESKQMYGVQFHPETSGESGERVLRNFLNTCK